MPTILENTEDGKLLCQSVNHPPHLSRDTMYFLEEKNGFMVFGCQLCTELTGQPQLHFLTVNRDSKFIYSRTRKAEHIERSNGILNFR